MYCCSCSGIWETGLLPGAGHFSPPPPPRTSLSQASPSSATDAMESSPLSLCYSKSGARGWGQPHCPRTKPFGNPHLYLRSSGLLEGCQGPEGPETWTLLPRSALAPSMGTQAPSPSGHTPPRALPSLPNPHPSPHHPGPSCQTVTRGPIWASRLPGVRRAGVRGFLQAPSRARSYSNSSQKEGREKEKRRGGGGRKEGKEGGRREGREGGKEVLPFQNPFQLPRGLRAQN